jgi:hypothetical protein
VIVGAEFVADHGRLNYNSVGIMRIETLSWAPLVARAYRNRAAPAKSPAVQAAVSVLVPLGIRLWPLLDVEIDREVFPRENWDSQENCDRNLLLLDVSSDNRQIDSSFLDFSV